MPPIPKIRASPLAWLGGADPAPDNDEALMGGFGPYESANDSVMDTYMSSEGGPEEAHDVEPEAEDADLAGASSEANRPETASEDNPPHQTASEDNPPHLTAAEVALLEEYGADQRAMQRIELLGVNHPSLIRKMCMKVQSKLVWTFVVVSSACTFRHGAVGFVGVFRLVCVSLQHVWQ
jgi:hypothetical protein